MQHRAIVSLAVTALLGLTACDGSETKPDAAKPADDAKTSDEPTPDAEEKPASTAKPEADTKPSGLEEGKVWRIELEGEGVASTHTGKLAYVLRDGDELRMSYSGSANGLVITLKDVPVGKTGTFTADPASFYATLKGIDCATSRAGKVEVELTANDAGHVAGRFTGEASCKKPEGATSTWTGSFDYAGKFDVK